MAFGSLSSLGFGSGVLTQDTIDKLKEAEQKARIDPYTKKIEENTTKQKDLTEIKTKLLSFQTAVSSLADATVFAKRKVVGSISDNPPASLTVNSGVALQSMNINVTQLAQKDVYQSKGLANDGGFVNAQLNGTADLTFFSNGKEYTVTVDKNTTYRDLADKINEASGGEIVAKIVNTGEKGTPYRLTLTSKETGEDSAISFYAGKKDSNGQYQSDSEAENIFSNLGWELDKTSSIDPAKDKKGYGIKDASLHIQTAQNAEFTLDGIKMFRSSNTVTDLGVGMTLTLNKTGEINFDVQQDFEGVTKAMQDLVDAYNDLVTNLNAATDYNSETGTKGTLQGISEVNSIRSSILADLFDSQVVDGTTEDANGNKVNTKVMLSMQDFGLSLNDAGTLSFDSSKFEQKVKEDPDSTESFFSNITKYEDINHTGEVIKTGSLSKYLNSNGGNTNGLEFKPGDFTIVFNNQTYDLSKNSDGTNFKLTGKTEEELLQTSVPDLIDYNMPENGVFHNLILAKIDAKYPAHAQQIMHAFWGVGQMSFVKHAIFVDKNAPSLKDYDALIPYMLDRFNTKKILISEGICDQLDHASPNSCFGGKAGLDACEEIQVEELEILEDEKLLELFKTKVELLNLKQFYKESKSPIVCILLDKKEKIEQSFDKLLEFKKHFRILVFLDAENKLENSYMLVWRVVNNIDAKRDIFIKEERLGVDASAKGEAEGYLRAWPKQTDCTKSVIEDLILRNILENNPDLFNKFEIF